MLGFAASCDALQNGEQAAEIVGDIGAFFVYGHGQNLLWTKRVFVFRIISFYDGRARPGDIVLGADALHGARLVKWRGSAYRLGWK